MFVGEISHTSFFGSFTLYALVGVPQEDLRAHPAFDVAIDFFRSGLLVSLLRAGVFPLQMQYLLSKSVLSGQTFARCRQGRVTRLRLQELLYKSMDKNARDEMLRTDMAVKVNELQVGSFQLDGGLVVSWML